MCCPPPAIALRLYGDSFGLRQLFWTRVARNPFQCHAGDSGILLWSGRTGGSPRGSGVADSLRSKGPSRGDQQISSTWRSAVEMSAAQMCISTCRSSGSHVHQCLMVKRQYKGPEEGLMCKADSCAAAGGEEPGEGAARRSSRPSGRLPAVSSDLRSTLEEQIGLDEIRNEFRGGGGVPEPRPRSASASVVRCLSPAAGRT